MNYYLDTEFNGYNGKLISVGLVSEDGRCLYLVNNKLTYFKLTDWVKENVAPLLNYVPIGVVPLSLDQYQFGHAIEDFFKQSDTPITVHVDWPDDVKYFSECLITGPGTMIDISGISFRVHRVDAYPNDIKGCIQHNAIWDAIALKYKLTNSPDILQECDT